MSKRTSFTQEITFNTSAKEIYELLMNSEKHSAFTGGEAIIGQSEGDDFSVFDGYAYGKNITLIPNQKIVQTWYAREENWDPSEISTIEFELIPLSDTSTKLIFTHRDIPEQMAPQFADGWKEFYWEPLAEMFNN